MLQNLDVTHLLMDIAGTDGFAEAVAAYEASDFATAARLFRLLAEKGDREAQFNIGMMLRQGQGIPLDEEAASFWLERAAVYGRV